MAPSRFLHDKAAVLRPEGPLNPGVYMIAILREHKQPTDDLASDDFLWIKCPGHKSVAVLIKAYKKTFPNCGDIKLFQYNNQLAESTLARELIIDGNLAVVEGVKVSSLEGRLINKKNDITPLKDITASATNKPTNILPPQLKSESIRSAANPPSSTTQHVTHANSPQQMFDKSAIIVSTPQTREPVPDHILLLEGWVDFTFERRESILRQPDINDDQTHRNVIDVMIANEWESLSPQQRSYFVERAQRFNNMDLIAHRCFWSYYYDNKVALVFDSGRDPHLDLTEMQGFFAKMMAEWERKLYLLPAHRRRAIDELNVHPLPPPPLQRSAVLPSASGCNVARGSSAVLPEHQKPSDRVPEQKVTEEETLAATDDTSAAFAESLGEDEPFARRLNISELCHDLPIEKLEFGVAKGVEILASIKQQLQTEQSPDSDQWLQAIGNIEKQAQRTKTIVGVVGATGAGKSSVINAMLDDERLVPTNCMRACTAVVTEISYNDTEIPYRAEIEFITREDWRKELKILFQDLLDTNGDVSRECTNLDSEAGIAYAKLKAVYPLLTREEMKSVTIDRLIDHNNAQVLGDNRLIEHEDSLIFYIKLQRYVDSKEKVSSKEKKTEAEKAKAKEMEFWPLIRVVRIYVKAPALATGAVIVDLPGVHDSNQARAAVAQSYLKKCTGLWIVAPITRAVDDKSAKNLLGESFKRQLKMDGGYNSVTFICSKTDDISITEASDTLGLDDEMAPLWARSDDLRNQKKSYEEEMENLKATKADFQDAKDAAEEQLEVWEDLQSKFASGKTIYAPKEKKPSLKRKRSSDNAEPRKKSKYTEEDDDDEDFIDDHKSDDEKESDNVSAADTDGGQGEPLTESAIIEKITELRSTVKEGRREITDLVQSIKDLRTQIQHGKKEQDDIDSQLSQRCIQGRNEYSRGAIQQDFASGIRELDQEIAEEEDAANFDPDVDIRDYDAVARSLPVFCVSSRGYQKLMGRLKKDKGVAGFQDVDETEVPQLQAHCKKLTEANREAACRRFLNSLSQFLNSLRLWSSSDGSGVSLTDGQLKREADLLTGKLKKLDTALEAAVKSIYTSIHGELQDQLYDTFPAAVSAAESKANDIQARWGLPYNRFNRAEGGLHYSTYKAVVRRDGTYTGSTGVNHFNEDLAEPIIKQVASGWERAFSRRLPVILAGLSHQTTQIMDTFHNDVEKRSLKAGANIASFQMLRQQLPTYRESIKEISNVAKDHITATQKDINREFVPTITQAMLPAYATATYESGPGSYKRMKTAMAEHVENVRLEMFQNSVGHVKQLLKVMLKTAQDLVLQKLDQVFLAMKRDYWSVVIGNDSGVKQGQQLPQAQRIVRREVLHLVDNVEALMKSAVGLESTEEKLEMGTTSTPEEAKSIAVDMQSDDASISAKTETQGADFGSSNIDSTPVISKPATKSIPDETPLSVAKTSSSILRASISDWSDEDDD